MRDKPFLALLFLIIPLHAVLGDVGKPVETPKAAGFRGIWYDLGQRSEHGSKYSGGLGTYTANHVPMAHYVEKVDRTYLTWGGTPEADQKKLLIMVSYYDHKTGKVARPVIVMDKSPVDDPHDNGSMSIDSDGHIWIFVSGRGNRRPGMIYRSKVPYEIDEWLHVHTGTFTYPQPWHFDGKGFLHTYTRYRPGRELFFRTSRDGIAWGEETHLASLEGHYQTSHQVGGRVLTAFNRHPGRNVDRRTDLYYLETADMGATWTTADGTPIAVPITEVDHPARVRDYSTDAATGEKRMIYISDMTADEDGRPIILYITTKTHQPGPKGERMWNIAHWSGTEWRFHEVATALHNYDVGSLYVEEDGIWKIIAPIGEGPQKWGTGGEVEMWTSADQGATWRKQRAITTNSERNHSYVRRPLNAHPDFHAYWADGNADELSPSHLWFTNKTGDKLWQLPYTMSDDFEAPKLVTP